MRTPERTVNYESLVSLAAQAAMRSQEMLTGALALSFVAIFPIPKSWAKKRFDAQELVPELVVKRPDIDNLAKALADGMNGIVYADDCQIACFETCVKIYGATPGVRVLVREFEL